MLNFLKKLFAKEEAQEEEIELNKLSAWLDEKAEPLFESLDNNIHQIIVKINNEKEKSAENLKILENAKLQNPKIPERVKTIMEGNRSAFIKKVSFFFDNLDLKHNNNNDYNKLIEKCSKIKEEIGSLGSSTARSYQILNEFFAREAENIAINIKKVEDCSKEIKDSINNDKISSIKKIKEDIAEIQNKIRLKEKYAIDLENNKKNLQSNKDKKAETEKKIDELKLGKGYSHYEKLLEERTKLKSGISHIESRLFHDFSVLERALKKYAKIAFENEKLILEYLSNPVIALSDDGDFAILKILDSLKGAVSGNGLGLDEKKRKKTLDKINELDSVYFAKMQDNFRNAKQRLNDTEHDVNNNESKKELESNNKELKIINEDIEGLNSAISNINNELEKISIEKLKEDLQEDVNSSLNARITIH